MPLPLSSFPQLLTRISLAVLGCLVLLPGATAATVALPLEPEPTSWTELTAAGLNPQWILPRGGLPAVSASTDLVTDMEKLLKHAGVVILIRDRVKALQVPGERTKFEAELDSRIKSLGLGEQQSEALRALLADGDFRSPTWQPDSESTEDGFFFGSTVNRTELSQSAWKSPRGSSLLQQGATLFAADVHAIKAVENDYGPYLDHVGNSYEAVYPRPGSNRTGSDQDGKPFSSLEVYWRCDLPFPFGDYECDLWVLNRIDDSKRLIADVYSTSEDFYWLAGRDTFLPVTDAEGKWVATLVVRAFGFDLKGIPDGDGERRTSIRGGLGNLKLRAELEFKESGSRCRDIEGKLPEIAVIPSVQALEKAR